METIEETMYKEAIFDFISESEGLSPEKESEKKINIKQSVDGKFIELDFTLIDSVLKRVDSSGKAFLQINFQDSNKLLLTNKLIGFKPVPCGGLDMSKLPKVVTTPDLISVFEAIEETISFDQVSQIEVSVLKKVFQSVLKGGEAVGFDLDIEKTWLGQVDVLRNQFAA